MVRATLRATTDLIARSEAAFAIEGDTVRFGDDPPAAMGESGARLV